MVWARCQTIAGVTQFEGNAGGGFWGFGDWNLLPRTTRVVLLSISYFEPDANVDLTVEIWTARPGGLPTERMPIARGIADGGDLINPITGAGELRACGITVPRDLAPNPQDPGQHWDVFLRTTGKLVTATACCDWMLCPYPDTTPQDSRGK